MIDLRRFLRLLDVVLAEGPTRAPEELVSTVVRTVRSAPWRPAGVEYGRRALVQIAFVAVAILALASLVVATR